MIKMWWGLDLPHLQKNLRAQVICRCGSSYLDETPKSHTASSPVLGVSNDMALSTAAWKGGITVERGVVA